jgi:hypothetical protein
MSRSAIIKKLEALRSEMLETETTILEKLHGLDPNRMESAKNLLHY